MFWLCGTTGWYEGDTRWYDGVVQGRVGAVRGGDDGDSSTQSPPPLGHIRGLARHLAGPNFGGEPLGLCLDGVGELGELIGPTEVVAGVPLRRL